MLRNVSMPAGSVDFVDLVDRTLVLTDGDERVITVDERSARTLREILEPATVSGCPDCGCAVLAALAVTDALSSAPPIDAVDALRDLADEAPTLHLYVVDHGAPCRHRVWRDPGYEEWCDAVEAVGLA